MVFFAYLISTVVFLLMDVIVTAIVLAFYTAIVGGIGKSSNTPYHSTNQFLGAFIGNALSAWLATFAFKWFEKEPNFYVLFLLFGFLWYLTNSIIKPEFRPTAQRIGATLGLLSLFIFLQFFQK